MLVVVLKRNKIKKVKFFFKKGFRYYLYVLINKIKLKKVKVVK